MFYLSESLMLTLFQFWSEHNYSRVRRIGETFYAENLHLYAGFHLYAGRRGRYALIGQLKQDLEFII
jgi:hypothetical protein